MDNNIWNVAAAKQSLSQVIAEAEDAPQRIYNRDRLVAAVISSEDLAAFERWRAAGARRSLGAAFAELRKIAAGEGYRLSVPRRRNRPDSLADALRRSPR